MKNLKFFIYIIIIFLKTGNLLSDNNIFHVNNIQVNKEKSNKNENLVNLAFKKAFNDLSKRLLLDKDYERISTSNLELIKSLISYYQITEPKKKDKKDFIYVNVFFDKNKMHNFFYEKNILYSDIKNTEVLFFPLLIYEKKYFIYSKNIFYDNWNLEKNNELIQYILPFENIENIQKINSYKSNIFELNLNEFFKEYENQNKSFAIINIEKDIAKIFIINNFSKKKINKTLSIKKDSLSSSEFNDKIIFEIKKAINDLIKSQNLIDVRTPSFLNVELKINKKSNLVDFTKRLNKIDLIETFYIQELNKDYAFIKIKYLGKINKIISRLKDEKINLKSKNGQWEINII